MTRFRRSILHVEPDEKKPFTYLFVHAFFNGLGVALAFAAINIIVIEKQGIEILPWLYVGTSVLVILAGYLYSKLEHAFPAKKVFIFSLIFCVLWAVAMRFLLAPHKSLLFIGVAYATYYLILVLTNLDLWGSAALVFNVRQSKRLFGPLSFSESMGSIAGYALTPVIVAFVPVENTMLLSGFSFLVSLIVLYGLRSKYLNIHHESEGSHSELHEPVQHKGKHFWSDLFHGNGYIKQLSLLILMSTLVFYTLSYGFLSRVEVQFTDLNDIAWFIGIFLSAAKVLNLFIKFIASSHVFTRFGVSFGLYLLPIIVISVCAVGLVVVAVQSPSSLFYVYLFSILYFFDKLFRSSLSKPSFLILFQPLTPSLRLSGHTITKGYFEPLGMGLAGLMIIIEQWLGLLSIQALIIYLLILSVFWLVACHKGLQLYTDELKDALKSRLFGSTPFKLSKKEIDLIVDTKLQSEDEVDKLYALSLITNTISNKDEALHYIQLLNSQNKEVVLTSLKKIETLKPTVEQAILEPLLTTKDAHVRAQAGYTYAAVLGESAIGHLMEQIDAAPEQNNVFIGALIKHAGIKGTLAVGHKLIQLAQSTDEEDRILAAKIIKSSTNPELYSLLIPLIKDRNDQVSTAAIDACSNNSGPTLIEAVMDQIDDRFLILPIKRCVANNQATSEKLIVERFDTSTRTQQLRLLDVCQKIESASNVDFLLSIANHPDMHLSSRAITSLSHLSYPELNPTQIKKLKSVIKSKLNELKQLFKTYNKSVGATVLIDAVNNEITQLHFMDILRLLGLIYPKETIDKIIRNLKQKEQTDIANAIELLENLLPNAWSNQLIPIVEQTYSITSKRIASGEPIVSELMHLSVNQGVRMSDFLLGLVIRSARMEQVQLPETFYTFAQERDSKLIAEELADRN